MSHIATVRSYVGIFLTLMVLTTITVIVAYFNLGQFNKIVALGIASLKATLVVLYFMHVKYSSHLTKLVIVTGIFFLIILLGLTMTDYATREWLPVPPTLQ